MVDATASDSLSRAGVNSPQSRLTRTAITLVVLSALVWGLTGQDADGAAGSAGATTSPQYLIFQTSTTPMGVTAYNVYDHDAREIASHIGTTGDGKRAQLGFNILIAPFMMSEQDMPKIIRSAFRVARERNMALHIAMESHYHWENRPDLWNWFDPKSPGYNPNNKNNVEWVDWKGSAHPARYLNWGVPIKLPPHMCYTSPKVRAEVERLVKQVVAPAVKTELDALKQSGKAYLLSGITVTSEPSLDNYTNIDRIDEKLARMMDKDKAPKTRLGYCALSHLGFSESKPPKDMERALAEINRDWAELWAGQFVAAGIPSTYLYTHVAAATGMVGEPGAELTNAPIWAAFNKHSRPGFTTYPVGKLAPGFDDIYVEVERNGNLPWGGVEATLLNPAISWKEYLSRHFDHGAAMVNILGFYEGAEIIALGKKDGPRGESALAAFRAFLTNQSLAGGEPASGESQGSRVQKKVQNLQSRIDGWVQRGGNPGKIQPLVKDFERLMKAGNVDEAETRLDEALSILAR